MLRGVFVTLIIITVAAFIGVIAILLAQSFPLYRLIDISSLILCIATGSIWSLMSRVYKTVSKTEHQSTFYALAVSSRTNLNYYDEHAVVRETAHFGITSLERAFIAPVIGYLLFGMTGLFIISAISSASWLYGREGQGQGFQTFISAIQRFIGLITAPVAVFTLLISSFLVPGASIFKAFNGLFQFKNKPSYMAGGKSLQIAAYALNTVFGGAKKDTNDKAISRVWIGPEGQSAKINPELLKPLQFMLFVASLIFICSLLILLISLYE